MHTIHALLFGAGFPPAGLTVTARFEGSRLIVDTASLALDAQQLIVSVGGFEQAELFLNWLDPQGAQVTLKPRAAADIATLLRTAPAALRPQLRQWGQRARNTRQVWGWIGAVAGGGVLLVALTWALAPRAAGWLAGYIPLSAEKKLGELTLAQLRASGDMIESGPMHAEVQRIGTALSKGSRYQYRWFIKKDKSVNAFAMPGGYVVVHSALLEKADSPTELAAVLAHEVQHIEQRHSLKQIITGLGWGALLTVAVGDASALATALAYQAGTLYFSRDMEAEADRLGFQALLRAGIKPDGMVTFFKKLQHEDKTSTLPAWVSSHPDTDERIGNIRALIARQPCPTCRPLDGDWKALLATLDKAEK